jgi:glutathione synthase/RimK-type ligase-like ATP-grasp enzyme
MPSRILVISRHDDAHIPVVQHHLPEPMIIIDPLAVIAGKTLTYSFNGTTNTVFYNRQALPPIKSVWYRKPTALYELNVPVPVSTKAYSEDALRKHCELLRDHLPQATWISPYYAIKAANSKSLGLRVAAGLGLQIPDTIFTSDSRAALDFIKGHATTVVKPLSSRSPDVKALGEAMFFARKVDAKTVPDLSGLHLAPTIFQAAIDTAYDIRVCVVDDQVFASKITNHSLPDSEVRDWRLGHFTGTIGFEAYPSLPQELRDKCVALVKKLGLLFGAIDLVRDKSGSYWFLEINPNGQWAFVDEPTVNNIGIAIAKILSS